MAKVAKLYYEAGLRQPEIADRLNLSQSRISRLLRQAVDAGLVRTVVLAPEGIFNDLEQGLVEKYGLLDAVVAEPIGDDDNSLLAALGSAGAVYLESTLSGAERVGLSSWSSTLLAVVNSMSPRNSPMATEIVQVIGGVGQPTVQVQANHLAGQLAAVTGATPRFFPAPGIVGSREARNALMNDRFLEDVIAHWHGLSTILAGIGALEPSALLASSGNAVHTDDAEVLHAAGAIGDVCLRFFDKDGEAVLTDVDDRVLGIGADALLAVPRRIGVAGGRRKREAVRAAVSGGWINILITDRATAESMLD